MPNYPTSLQAITSNLIFPTDLNTNSGFIMQLQLAQYTRPNVFTAPVITPISTITLPMPLKINEQTSVVWQQDSLVQQGADITNAIATLGNISISNISSAIGSVANLFNRGGGYAEGVSINPFLVMLFKNVNFKVHNLQWVFAPNSVSDTNNLQQIINILKNAMLPGYDTVTLNYPAIVLPSFGVENQTYSFKACVIESFSVDWSPGPNPSFFTNTGAPTLVCMSMQLKEIELWYRNSDIGTTLVTS